jgi:hypothetical protein
MKRAHSAALPIACRTKRRRRGTSSRTTSRARGRSRLRMPAALASACVMAALLAACGGSSTGPAGGSASPSPASPTPVPSPQITSGTPPKEAVAVVRRFWTLVGEGRITEALDLTTPDSDQRLVDEWGITSARFVGVVPHSVSRGPLPEATIEFAVRVLIEPEQGPAGQQWGDARDYQLFEQVARMSDGTWRLVSSGTGP